MFGAVALPPTLAARPSLQAMRAYHNVRCAGVNELADVHAYTAMHLEASAGLYCADGAPTSSMGGASLVNYRMHQQYSSPSRTDSYTSI